MTEWVEIAKLTAAGGATVCFLVASFVRMHWDMDRIVDSFQRAGRWTAAGTLFAAAVFAAEFALYFV